METNDITSDIWCDLHDELQDIRCFGGLYRNNAMNKCYNIFNEDRCRIILLDNKYWYAEKTSIYNYIPKYFIDFLTRYLKRHYGYEYLYDKFPFPNKEV